MQSVVPPMQRVRHAPHPDRSRMYGVRRRFSMTRPAFSDPDVPVRSGVTLAPRQPGTGHDEVSPARGRVEAFSFSWAPPLEPG
jgi:hypothetical protein